jgi:hypothetical protein
MSLVYWTEDSDRFKRKTSNFGNLDALKQTNLNFIQVDELTSISGAGNTLAGVGSARQHAGCRRTALTFDCLSGNGKARIRAFCQFLASFDQPRVRPEFLRDFE